MPAQILSVNLAVPRTLRARGREIRTGIFKEPVDRRVRAVRLGLEGDFQVDKRFHGGPEKAVFLYGAEHGAYWRKTLGLDAAPGYFGENLTTEGLVESDVAVGDTYRAGSVLFQVTTPRSPCYKLGLRVGSTRFLKTFLESGRLGFYVRVVEEGDVGAGDPIERVSRPERPLLLPDLIRLMFFRPVDPDAVESALGSGSLDASLREHLEELRLETRSTRL